MNHTEQEEAAIDKISSARQGAADREKKFNDVLLRSEEKSKKDIWKIKKKTAIKEKKIMDIKEKTLQAQHLTALIERNVAIVKFNQLTGKSISVPPLPDMND